MIALASSSEVDGHTPTHTELAWSGGKQVPPRSDTILAIYYGHGRWASGACAMSRPQHRSGPVGLFQSSTSPFNLASPLPMRPCNLTPHLSIRLHHRPTLLNHLTCRCSCRCKAATCTCVPSSPARLRQSSTAAWQHSILNNIFSQQSQERLGC